MKDLIADNDKKLKNLVMNYIAGWGAFVVTGLVLYSLMLGSVLPKNPDVHLHEIATADIQSPIDAIDTQATEAKKQEAIVSTPSAYTYDKNKGLMQVEKVGDLFDTIASVKKDMNINVDTSPTNVSAAIQKIADGTDTSQDQGLSDRTLRTLVIASDHDLQVAEDITSTSIYEAMNAKVGWNDLEKAQSKAAANLPSSVLNDQMRTALTEVLRDYITANYTFDATATKRNKQEAASSVDNIVIHQGEVIVHKGELVTNDMIRQLKLVGLLDNHFNIIPFIGLFLFTAFITTVFWYEYYRFNKDRKNHSIKYLYIFTIIFLCAAALIKICSYLRLTEITGLSYIVPIAVAPLLLRSLLSEQAAIVSAVLLSLIGSVIFGISTKVAIFDAPMAIYLLFSALSGAIVFRGNSYRPKIFQTGSIVALVNATCVLALLMFQNTPFTATSFGMNLGFSALSGFLAVILANGVLPLFETGFSILTPIRLIELSNPNQPLLRKILLEAPGTYHHSVMVANLAERACEVIGANGLLARVAAYYHDIGKTKRPKFFVENQLDGVNPHEKISPQLSRTIIAAHPYDGADLLRAAGMPKEIVAIAEQHHGTTLIRYFYAKACEMATQSVPESEFRYPGPKVQTREAAVVELADSVEAAVRSMKKPTPGKVQNLIHSIFSDRLSDGQFDECDITLKELKLVVKSIDETLRGVYHSRIEYPNEIKMKMNKVNEK
ncbi:HD family phosphohydrolase [Sporolactobacillus spathodeae]|uniref:Nucleotidyltransferase with HDIG domain n=1 Tax=Sporolactobacillus spathodeae TaxID=1465502 RepID=A0ABS2Q851_9BACL|nr:HDIG domain-containing metalloprotein [Sporolactobacillus spathodeae]MBM7657339.1 putative nucleotidyltransferase with HDIG domain [Sporolactobacillus spathodeae]